MEEASLGPSVNVFRQRQYADFWGLYLRRTVSLAVVVLLLSAVLFLQQKKTRWFKGTNKASDHRHLFQLLPRTLVPFWCPFQGGARGRRTSTHRLRACPGTVDFWPCCTSSWSCSQRPSQATGWAIRYGWAPANALKQSMELLLMDSPTVGCATLPCACSAYLSPISSITLDASWHTSSMRERVGFYRQDHFLCILEFAG